MPSPSVSDFVYAALLYSGESPANPSSTAFVQGTKATDSENVIFSFQRPNEKSGLTLEVFAFKSDITVFSKDAAILSGKTKNALTVNDDSETINVTETITLEVNTSSTEKGTVSLKIKVPDECLLDIDDEANFNCNQKDGDIYTLAQNGTGIDAKVYKVTFTVKKVNETDNTKEEIIHIFTESINVLPGMRTDTWWNGNVSTETKEITQDMISSTVYVRGAGGWYDTTSPYNDGDNATASDTNSGSFLSPFATIQKAVDTVIARNDGTSEYTIYVDGTLDGTTAALLGENGMADFSALTKNLNLTIKALSGTATLDGGARFDADGNVEAGKEGIKKCIIYAKPASGALNLTLENLVIMGGYRPGNYSGGISFNSPGGELKISNGTTIRGNKATYAGGVNVYGGTFTMTGGTISDCTANSTGGGVYISPNGTFNMSGTAKITGCKTTSTGGNSGGGGIYNEGTLIITGGTISNCTAASSGGGIYNNASDTSVTTTIENYEISGCKALGNAAGSSYGGGGIYNASGMLKLTNVNITGGNDIGNPDARFGGGIYNAGTLIVTRGTISKCTSTSSGGGIYNSSGTLKITGGTISNCITDGNGGGIRTGGPASSDATTTAEIENCTIESCTANTTGSGEAGGGGIYCYRQALTLAGGTISNCTSENQGGGISIVSHNTPFTIDGVEITDCNAQNGGGCHILATAAESVTKEIKNCIIKSCEATTAGGGIGSTQYYNITVSSTEISECVSPSGSGIFTRSNSSLLLKDSTIKNDVCTNTGDTPIYLAGSTTITEGVIDFSAYTSTSKPKLYVQDLAQSPVATIKLGTAYQVGDTILQAAEGYTLTEEDCKRFTIDGGSYDIALSDGNGVLVMGEVYLNSSSGDDANSGLTASNAVKTLSKAIELFDSQYAQRIMVCAEYTLPSNESGLLDRMWGGVSKN